MEPIGRIRVYHNIVMFECGAFKLVGWSYHKTQSGEVISGVWPRLLNNAFTSDVRAHINYKELWVVKEALRRDAHAHQHKGGRTVR